jgi:hypothetical protein
MGKGLHSVANNGLERTGLDVLKIILDIPDSSLIAMNDLTAMDNLTICRDMTPYTGASGELWKSPATTGT